MNYSKKQIETLKHLEKIFVLLNKLNIPFFLDCGTLLKFIRNDTSNYFMLDNAISNNNIAEAALLAISFLQNETGLYKEMISFYKGLKGLNSVGLDDYARSYAMEENFYFLVK